MKMKRIVISSCLFLMFALESVAGKYVNQSFGRLYSEQMLSVKWDFSQTLFEDRLDEDQWAAFFGNEWEQAKKEVMDLILEKMNDELEKNLLVVRDNEKRVCRYTLVISPSTLDRRGNNVTDYILIDNENHQEVARKVLKGDGGRIGSPTNLFGDGYRSTSSKLAKLIKKDIKQNKKK